LAMISPISGAFLSARRERSSCWSMDKYKTKKYRENKLRHKSKLPFKIFFVFTLA
jgi:hypothetical protein